MATVNDLIGKMKQRDVRKVIVTSGTPMRLFTATGEAAGPTMAAADLDTMLKSVMPGTTWDFFEKTGRLSFGHFTEHGHYFLSATRNAGATSLTVRPFPSIIARLLGVVMILLGACLAYWQIQEAHRLGKFFPVFLAMAPVMSAMGIPMVLLAPLQAGEEQQKKVFGVAGAFGAVIGLALYGLLKLGYV